MSYTFWSLKVKLILAERGNAMVQSKGANQLANVLSKRMRETSKSPQMLDFGEIQANGSLLTNTFPVPIPKGDYTVCRQLTLGESGSILTVTDTDGTHSHSIQVPEQMRSICPGDRVLVAWVQNEAVVIDVIMRS